MKTSEQTDAIKVQLYNLTLSFVHKYQPRYYKQYQGDHEDLAMKFYCEFLTAKAREKGKEASLLDKFDARITTLPYLVKVSVQRMLIDSSRKDCVQIKHIDNYVDEYGDCITQAFALVAEETEETVDTRVFTADEIVDLKIRWSNLTSVAQIKIKKQYAECKCALVPMYRDMLEEVLFSE